MRQATAGALEEKEQGRKPLSVRPRKFWLKLEVNFYSQLDSAWIVPAIDLTEGAAVDV